MIEILGRATSINVRKVLWTCVEIGLEFRLEQWGSGELSLQRPEFLALNPNGLIPVLRDGELVLWESNSICRYLAAKHGRTDLLPADPAQRGRVEQWMDWQATELNNAWRYAFLGLVRHSAAHADPAAIDASVRSWNRHMQILDDALAKSGGWITAGGFTLADVVLGLATHRWRAAPIEHATLPAVAAYYERLGARPGFLAHGRNGGA